MKRLGQWLVTGAAFGIAFVFEFAPELIGVALAAVICARCGG